MPLPFSEVRSSPCDAIRWLAVWPGRTAAGAAHLSPVVTAAPVMSRPSGAACGGRRRPWPLHGTPGALSAAAAPRRTPAVAPSVRSRAAPTAGLRRRQPPAALPRTGTSSHGGRSWRGRRGALEERGASRARLVQPLQRSDKELCWSYIHALIHIFPVTSRLSDLHSRLFCSRTPWPRHSYGRRYGVCPSPTSLHRPRSSCLPARLKHTSIVIPWLGPALHVATKRVDRSRSRDDTETERQRQIRADSPQTQSEEQAKETVCFLSQLRDRFT